MGLNASTLMVCAIDAWRDFRSKRTAAQAVGERKHATDSETQPLRGLRGGETHSHMGVHDRCVGNAPTTSGKEARFRRRVLSLKLARRYMEPSPPSLSPVPEGTPRASVDGEAENDSLLDRHDDVGAQASSSCAQCGVAAAVHMCGRRTRKNRNHSKSAHAATGSGTKNGGGEVQMSDLSDRSSSCRRRHLVEVVSPKEVGSLTQLTSVCI